MSQEVKIAGALFSDVPSIQVPDSNDVYHSFTDTSDTTATASDVASGKYFYTSAGVKTAGTASGGGGVTPELVYSLTYDKLLVQDAGVTLPSYSTSSTTLVPAEAVTTITVDYNYHYFSTLRALNYPIYSGSTLYSGKLEYCAVGRVVTYSTFAAGAFKAFDGTIYNSTSNQVYSDGRCHPVTWKSATALRTSPANIVDTKVSASISTAGVITINKPSIAITNSSSYYNTTAWNETTDIRCQYIYQTFRVPIADAPEGYATTIGGNILHVLDCIYNNNKNLT